MGTGVGTVHTALRQGFLTIITVCAVGYGNDEQIKLSLEKCKGILKKQIGKTIWQCVSPVLKKCP